MSSSACAAEAGFAAAMAAIGGWEERPRLAIAVSGGPDSLALAMLAEGWARLRGGNGLALILDHAIRPAAATEAMLAAAWARAHGLGALSLRLPGGTAPRPAALRAARLAALEAASREAGALHLLLGQHRSDQAETLLLRAMDGSGPAGLAGIAPVRFLAHVRLVRPLLAVPPGALRAFLAARGQGWIDDPSNHAGGTRAVLRRHAADSAGEGAAALALAEAAGLYAASRHAVESAAASLLGRAASLAQGDEAILLDGPCLHAAPRAVAREALSAVLRAVSSAPYPPDMAGVCRALDAMGAAAGRALSVGGCVLRPSVQGWRVMRDPRRLAAVAHRRCGPSRLWP